MSDFVYLDNAATSFPKPPEVIKFMCDFYSTRGVNPGRSGFDLALEAEETVAEARQTLCDFFGGTVRDRLVFGHNVTDVLNLVIASVLEPGDHAISTCGDAGFSGSRDIFPFTGGMTGIGDDRQVRKMLCDGNSVDVEGVARVFFKGTDAAFAEHHARIAMA